MSLSPLRATAAVLSVMVTLATGPHVSAESYPSRPITIIAPFPAGGVTDLVARIVAERMRISLGQPVIVEDLTGAGGTIAVGRVVHAVPNGYTLSSGDLTSHVSSSAIFPVAYDVQKDLEPVALLSSAPQLFVGRTGLPATNLKDLIAWLKANPGKATMALPGTFGSGGHLSGLSLQKSTSTHFQFVPYRGAPPAVQDLMGGHVDLLFTDASNVLPHVHSGQLKAYGVTTRQRWAPAPEIPTMQESGIALYFSLWRGLWAPKNTPKEIIAKLNAAVVDALADPGVRSQLAKLGNEIPAPDQQTPTALHALQQSEIEKWWPIIKAANIKPE